MVVGVKVERVPVVEREVVTTSLACIKIESVCRQRVREEERLGGCETERGINAAES